ncbi:hypothetical protein GYMLUDRAFT_492835 [Collybiopsis luxurians FD-317 M1]|uniref:Uncharacterized protein n=1 Tax=Collybiopsis luxurians FD-317 M1 TaxID=944289 RepID=A0A0D0CTT7_9AGAR|nr:hypothetical protein GYMLUDRAFT_242508 [Collybiopsis luxurians FD-317 M1]KIK62882.1 hypothetical protein GYMLUDRAFT_492835 [Collybiopsis luxurians FD-317 M1]
MSNQLLPSNSTSEWDIQPPPTLVQVAERDQAILRNVITLNSGASRTTVSSVIVQEETEVLLKENVAKHAMILRDHKRVVADLKEAIARQKEGLASMEAALAVLEAVQGN